MKKEDLDIDDIDIEDLDFDLEINEDAPIEYEYYLIGDRPVRIKYIGSCIPVSAEILNNDTKKLEIDNFYLDYIAQSTEIIEINEADFINTCLKKGAKPPEKD